MDRFSTKNREVLWVRSTTSASFVSAGISPSLLRHDLHRGAIDDLRRPGGDHPLTGLDTVHNGDHVAHGVPELHFAQPRHGLAVLLVHHKHGVAGWVLLGPHHS